jgi:hypothetical protein
MIFLWSSAVCASPNQHEERDVYAAVILSAAKNLIQYCATPAITSTAASSFRFRRGSMDEILRR